MGDARHKPLILVGGKIRTRLFIPRRIGIGRVGKRLPDLSADDTIAEKRSGLADEPWTSARSPGGRESPLRPFPEQLTASRRSIPNSRNESGESWTNSDIIPTHRLEPWFWGEAVFLASSS